jgi:glycosyltransferase involved in cell wall biosynthesis
MQVNKRFNRNFMFDKPSVVIYRNFLLAASETFIRSQTEMLQHFIPSYVGLRFIAGLGLPKERTLIVNRGGLLGKIGEVSTKLRGFGPAFVQQVKNLHPVLVHAHFGQDGAIALPLVKNLQVPLVVTFHGLDATVRNEYAEHSLTQRMYFRRREQLKHEAKLFIAVSEFIKQKLMQQGFPPEKIIVHYIGVDTERFQPDPALQRKPVVLFVGRLVEKKGCEYLIRAMSAVQAAIPEVELVVIGDGVLRSSLEQLAKKLLKHYRFLGVQPPESVRTWMQTAKIFCVPSITARSGDSEGFGMVFIEAQATGLPVVSFISGGISEAVADGETGLLAPEGDWQKLAMYIRRLLTDRELWQKFSRNGQVRVRNNFNLRHQTRVLESIYNDKVLQSAFMNST